MKATFLYFLSVKILNLFGTFFPLGKFLRKFSSVVF